MFGSNAHGHGRVGWRGWLGGGLTLSAILIWIPQPVYAAIGAFLLAQWQILLTGLVIFGLAGIAVSTVAARRRSTQEAGSDEVKPLLREIPGWAIWAGMACLVAVGLLATWWLVTSYGSGDSKTIEQNRIKLEAIKLAGSVVVGTGGVAALLLAARRQRVSELDLLQRDRVAEINRHDAEERRATELYTAAAEQLASDKAPVRMAGMYALSRLGEAHKNLRQTIINLLCAYLRMPDISLDKSPSSDITPDRQGQRNALQRLENSTQPIVIDLASAPLTALTAIAPDLPSQKQQERQVRLTAQRLLEHHLRPLQREEEDYKNGSFWPRMDIDLANADLHDWDLSSCSAQRADFRGARFHGETSFEESTFHGNVEFNDAEFNGETFFGGAHFYSEAHFEYSQFHSFTRFSNTQFHDVASFNGAHFQTARFRGAQFHYGGGFNRTTFHLSTWFGEAQFYALARFTEAQFHHDANFTVTRFHGGCMFHGSEFQGDAYFDEARFYGPTQFNAAQFDGVAEFNKTQFHDNTNLNGALFRIEPMLEDAWARISTGKKLVKSTWPTVWAVHEINLKNAQDRWGRLTIIE